MSLDDVMMSGYFRQSSSMDRWSLANANLDSHLAHYNSIDEAMGGDLAGQCALSSTSVAVEYGGRHDALEGGRSGWGKQAGRFDRG